MKKFLLGIFALSCLGFVSNAQTVESIFKQAIDNALNKKFTLESIKDIAIDGVGTAMGQELQLSIKYILPNNFSQKVSMGGQVMMRQHKIDEDYKMMQQGQDAPITDDLKKAVKEQANFLPEIFFLQNLGDYSLVGKETMDGHEVYNIKYSGSDDKRKINIYYSINPVQRVKMVVATDRGAITLSYLEYKEFPDGLVYYSKLSQDFNGQFAIDFNINKIKVNGGLTKDALKE